MFAWQQKSSVDRSVRDFYAHIQSEEERLAGFLRRPIQDLDILEIGPGQDMDRALYFGRKNRVQTLDLDVIPVGFSLSSYARMLQKNGLGRVIKSLGRYILTGRRRKSAWRKILGVSRLNYPSRLQGDICQSVPGESAFDLVVSWSVFEHLPDPASALQNVIRALRPGGAFFISLHLYTSIAGHHDMRAFTGNLDALPVWGHLRPPMAHLIHPSAYLNEWRLDRWRQLFSEMAPGFVEILESYEHREVYGPLLTGELRQELAAYSDEELLTVNAVYAWRKGAQVSSE
jgi:SAM-dependent methyltransferase